MPKLPEVYRALRRDVEECVSNPLHDEKTFPCFKACAGRGVVGYYNPEKCQVLFVALSPSLSEAESAADLRAPFVDEYGQRFNSLLQGTPLYGDARIGFTTLVKCHLKNKRTLKKTIAACAHWFEEELKLVRPAVVVCLGRHVAEALCPELFFLPNGDGKKCAAPPDGTFYTALDRTFYFMRDPTDKDDGYINPKGGIKDGELTYVKWVVPGQFDELAAALVPSDEWFVRRHSSRGA